ncbi:MAG: hypothetical protein ABI134_26515 [Byssovorax sp.]
MFDWEGYLRLAEELSKSKDNESHHRAAVSRAYYAAFNIALLYVKDIKQARVTAGKVHESVWLAFETKRPGIKLEEYRTRDYGFKLRDFRVSADYKAEGKNFGQTALSAISLAKSIITSVNSLRQSQQSTQ